jgi:nucleotide-binding universal stress UspA family protein
VVLEHHIDLVLLQSDSPAPSSCLLEGSVAEEVFRSGVCACALIGSRVNTRSLNRGMSGPVVFATNLQEPRIATIRLASELAAVLGVSLECVHVLPRDLEAKGTVAHIIPEVMRRALIHGAVRHDILLSTESCRILYGSSVSIAIANYAKQRHASLLVLAVSRRVPYISHWSPGITARLIAAAPCPVVTRVVNDRGSGQWNHFWRE